MFTSAVAQTSFNTISQAPMNSLFPASAALAKTAVLFSALMLSQASIASGQEVQPGEKKNPLLKDALLALLTGEEAEVGLYDIDMLTLTPLSDKCKSDDKGDCYRGHYYDYATYPHGHYDSAHGSTAFDPYLSKTNEDGRMREFFEDGNCRRGVNAVDKVELNEVVVCNPNGQITRTATQTRDL